MKLLLLAAYDFTCKEINNLNIPLHQSVCKQQAYIYYFDSHQFSGKDQEKIWTKQKRNPDKIINIIYNNYEE